MHFCCIFPMPQLCCNRAQEQYSKYVYIWSNASLVKLWWLSIAFPFQSVCLIFVATSLVTSQLLVIRCLQSWPLSSSVPFRLSWSTAGFPLHIRSQAHTLFSVLLSKPSNLIFIWPYIKINEDQPSKHNSWRPVIHIDLQFDLSFSFCNLWAFLLLFHRLHVLNPWGSDSTSRWKYLLQRATVVI